MEPMKQMIGSECLVDETTGLTAATTGNSGQTVAVGAANSLPPSSAVVRLDQMSGPVYTVAVPDMILGSLTTLLNRVHTSTHTPSQVVNLYT